METSATQPPAQPPPRLNFFNRLLDNPVILKELKGRMRGRQGFITMTLYLLLIGFFVTSVYLVFYSEGDTASPELLQNVGKALFSTVVLLELSMISFIGPALTSGAIASERERQTFDLLQASLLTPTELVFGKLTSAVSYLLLLIFAAIPVESLAFFLGGVGAAEMIISTLMLVVTAVFFCALGLFFSSFTKRVLTSTVLTYGSYLFSFVLFFFLLFTMALVSPFSSSTQIWEDIYSAALWFIFSLNPLFAAGMSEAILIEDQSLFLTNNSGIWGSTSFPLLSPWIIYSAFHVFAASLLILISVLFVSRVEK